MKRIVFVCSGNTCRSPLAEGIAKKVFSKKLLKEIEISSAGTSAVEGQPASLMAIEIARKNSIDLTGHKARLLTRTLIRGADLLVTMTSEHLRTIGQEEGSALAYAVQLASFCEEEPGDIADPVGQGLDAYERIFGRISACVEKLRDQLDDFNGWKP